MLTFFFFFRKSFSWERIVTRHWISLTTVTYKKVHVSGLVQSSYIELFFALSLSCTSGLLTYPRVFSHSRRYAVSGKAAAGHPFPGFRPNLSNCEATRQSRALGRQLAPSRTTTWERLLSFAVPFHTASALQPTTITPPRKKGTRTRSQVPCLQRDRAGQVRALLFRLPKQSRPSPNS